jgi:hypothetical protein
MVLTFFLGNNISPPPKRRANEWIAMRLATGCRLQERLNLAPPILDQNLGDHPHQENLSFNCNDPPCLLLM